MLNRIFKLEALKQLYERGENSGFIILFCIAFAHKYYKDKAIKMRYGLPVYGFRHFLL